MSLSADDIAGMSDQQFMDYLNNGSSVDGVGSGGSTDFNTWLSNLGNTPLSTTPGTQTAIDSSQGWGGLLGLLGMGSSATGSNASGLTGLLNGLLGTNASGSQLGLGGLASLGALGTFLDNKPTSKATTSTVDTALPSWYTDAAKNTLNSASALPAYDPFFNGTGTASAALTPDQLNASTLANTGYKPYEGNLTLGPNANTTKAGALASSSAGMFAPWLGQAKTAADNGGKSLLDMNIASYMNPYWDMALTPAAQKIKQDQALSEQALNEHLAKTGSFGGSRTAVAQTLNAQEGNRRIDDLYSTGAKSAFDSAMGLASGDRTAQQGLSSALSGLASTGSGLVGSDVSRLSSTGSDLYNTDMGNLMRPYTEFQRQQSALPGQITQLSDLGKTAQTTADTDITRRWQDYMQNMQTSLAKQGAMTTALGTVKPPVSSTSVNTESASAPSPWQSLFGAGSTLYGLANPSGA